MKKFLSILLALVSLLTLSFSLTACGEEKGTESLTYQEQSDGTLYVTGINDGTEKVVVPSKKDGKVVSGIEEDAFRGNRTVAEVTLPSSVKYIADSAFYNASKLIKINLGKVETLGKNAFRGTRLLACDLSSILSMGDYAFYGTSISSVQIPAGITEIPKSCFSSCTLLATVTMPTTVKTVKANAFNGCNSLSSINLDSVKVIEDSAFASCKSMYTLSLNSIVDIQQEAFASTPLQTITIGNSCQRIYCCAFNSTTTTSITLGSATLDTWYLMLVYPGGGSSYLQYSPSYPQGWTNKLANPSECAGFLTRGFLDGSYICTRTWGIDHNLGEPVIIG